MRVTVAGAQRPIARRGSGPRRPRTRELARRGRRRPHTPGHLTRDHSRGGGRLPGNTAPERNNHDAHDTRHPRGGVHRARHRIDRRADGVRHELRRWRHRRRRRRRARRDGGFGLDPRLARLRRRRQQRPGGRLGVGLRGGDRLHGRIQDVRHVRRGGQPHEDGRVRRRRGIRRCDAATHRRRRRRPGQHRPDPELRGRLRLPEGPGVELRRRRLVRRARTATAPTCSCTTRRSSPRRPPRGTSSSTRRASTPARSPRTTRRSTSPMPRCT